MISSSEPVNDREDAQQLSQLGYKQELQRNFSFTSMICMTFAILNSWTALTASLSVALPSGGPITILWGLYLVSIGQLAIAPSLAEICSVYPTASAGSLQGQLIIGIISFTNPNHGSLS